MNCATCNGTGEITKRNRVGTVLCPDCRPRALPSSQGERPMSVQQSVAEAAKRILAALPPGAVLHVGEIVPLEARELPDYTDTHDGQTEPSIWPPLDDEGFPF